MLRYTLCKLICVVADVRGREGEGAVISERYHGSAVGLSGAGTGANMTPRKFAPYILKLFLILKVILGYRFIFMLQVLHCKLEIKFEWNSLLFSYITKSLLIASQ
jgi:hypothetical protein